MTFRNDFRASVSSKMPLVREIQLDFIKFGIQLYGLCFSWVSRAYVHLSLTSKVMDRSTYDANAYIPISFPKKT